MSALRIGERRELHEPAHLVRVVVEDRGLEVLTLGGGLAELSP